LEFPALLKREPATKPYVILTSPSGSLASDLFWPEIWGNKFFFRKSIITLELPPNKNF
jgi:hypothetical protein